MSARNFVVGLVRIIGALAFVVGAAAAQTTNPTTSVPVTLSFHGSGSGDASGGFSLQSAGTMTPFGAAELYITGQLSKETLNVYFFIYFNNDSNLSSGGTAKIGPSGIVGTASGISGSFDFSITPSLDAMSSNVEVTVTGSGTLLFNGSLFDTLPENSGADGYPIAIPGSAGFPLLAGASGSSTTCFMDTSSMLPTADCSPLTFTGDTGSNSSTSVFSGSGGGSALVFGGSSSVTFNGSGSNGGLVLVFNGPSSTPTTINVATPPQSMAATYAATVSCPGTPANCWIAIPASSASGTIAESSMAAFPAVVNPQGLGPGVYQANVAIQIAPNGGAASTLNVPVTVVISALAPMLTLSQTGLQFQGTDTATDEFKQILQQFVTVSNSGPGSLSFSARASTLSGGDWLYVWPASGTVAPSAAGQVVNIQASTVGLSPGTYFGRVDFTAPGAANSPQSVEVVFTVLETTTGTVPLVSPTSLLFVEPAGGKPDSQTLQVFNVPGGQVHFATNLTFEQGNGWFTVSASSANEGDYCTMVGLPGCPSPVPDTVTVNPSGLGPGVFQGTLDFHFPKIDADLPVPITLVVTEASPAQPTSQSAAASGPCTPTRLLPAFTNLVGGFQVDAGIPVPVQVQVSDDCGSPLTSGSVIVYFPGAEDPLVSLAPLGSGQWVGSWMPHNLAGGQEAVGVIASLFSAPIYGSAGLVGHVNQNKAVPLVDPGGVVSAASLAANAPLAPGSYISIFGSNLASAAQSASSLPLQTTLAGTQVLLGGQPLLLNYASPTQINAVVPYGTPVNTVQPLTIVQNEAYSLPESVIIAAAQPAVLTQNQSGKGAGLIVVAKSNGEQFLNTPTAPATAGDALIIYCSGLGAVNPPVPDGTAAPSSPLSSTTNPVTVTIGGQPAQVFFAGLAPGFAGLYQVNVYVPQGVAASSNAPVVLTAAGASSPPVTVAIK